MKTSLLALLMLSLLASPAFAHGSHDDDVAPPPHAQKLEKAPTVPAEMPAAEPVPRAAAKEPTADSQAAPTPAEPDNAQ